jgi:hypothetical protein
VLSVIEDAHLRGTSHRNVKQPPLFSFVNSGAIEWNDSLLDAEHQRGIDGQTFRRVHGHYPDTATFGGGQVFPNGFKLTKEPCKSLVARNGPTNHLEKTVSVFTNP